MSDDLVERVEAVIARQMMKTVPYEPGDRMYLSVAHAAIAIVLEEAARCVRRMPAPASDWMADELLRALGGPANQVPAAIRARGKKKHD